MTNSFAPRRGKNPSPPEDIRYEAGWLDGRSRKEPTSENQSYLSGWVQGDIAADEAANHDPYGPRW